LELSGQLADYPADLIKKVRQLIIMRMRQ
jgi:hypothetical protein